MSVRADALTDHQVNDYRDHAAVIARLSQTIPVARQVRDYWRAVDPESVENHEVWSAYHIGRHNPSEDYLRYDGPGGLHIHFGSRVATIGAACRWSGFVTIAAMQSVHLPAFRALARALGGTRIVLLREDDPVQDISRYDGCSLDACIALLQQRWGPPHPKTEIISEDVEVIYRRKFPPWYIERLDP